MFYFFDGIVEFCSGFVVYCLKFLSLLAFLYAKKSMNTTKKLNFSVAVSGDVMANSRMSQKHTQLPS